MKSGLDENALPNRFCFADAVLKDSASRNVERALFLFVILWAIAKGYEANVSILWMDERFSFFADQVATVWGVIKVQATWPLALDPPLTHIIQHFSLLAGDGNLFIYRLPSLVFCFAMLFCVYLYLRRLGGVYLGGLAAAILLTRAIVAGQFANARPYALLLGATGVALLLWQNCIRGIARRSSLVGLFLVLGVGVATHFYGVLLPVPFLITEAYRARERRKLDLPVLSAILVSFVSALSWVACMKAVKQYRTHYYHSPRFSILEIYRGFSTPLSETAAWQTGAHLGRLLLLEEHALSVLFFGAVAFGLYAGSRASTHSTTVRAEWVAIGLLASLPLFGIVLSHIAVGTFEARFTLEHSIGVAAALSATVLFFVRSRVLCNVVLFAACVDVATKSFHDLRSGIVRRATVAKYAAQLNRSSFGKTGLPAVFADYDLYLLFNAQYRQTPAFMTKAIWLYDLDRSVAWRTTDTPDRTVMNLGQFTPVEVVPYDSFIKAVHHFQYFDVTPAGSGPSWLPDGIRADGGVLRPIETVDDPSGLIKDHAIYDVELPDAK